MNLIKHALTLLFAVNLFIAIPENSNAQGATKYPLLEHFTNTRCPICASRNPGFHELRQSFGEQLNHIAFHPKYPYSTCAFYQANKEGNQSRTEHYGINGTPVVYLDGTEGQGTNLVRESSIESALQQNSYFELEVMEEANGNMVTVTIVVHAKGQAPETNSYRLFVVAVEEAVAYAAPNGENSHYNVFRTFSSPMQGVPIPAINDMESDTFTYQYQVDNSWIESEMYSIAFLQNDQDQSIENSGRSVGIISSSGLQEKANQIVYPVPTRDRIFFTQQVEAVRVHDISGRFLFEQIIPIGSNSASLGNLQSGLYILRLDSGEEISTHKIVIE